MGEKVTVNKHDFNYNFVQKGRGVELDLSIKVDINKEIVVCQITKKNLIWGCVYLFCKLIYGEKGQFVQ